MDNRMAEYGSWAILGGPFLYAALTIHRSAQQSAPDFKPSTIRFKNDIDNWQNDIDQWSVDMPDVNTSVSSLDTLLTCLVLLVAFSPILILTAVCALHAANQLRLYISTSTLWNNKTRLVLILLFTCAVWAGIKPQNWFDRCALASLLLLLAWNMMRHCVLPRGRRVWNTVVYAVPVVLLLLAVWAMKTSRTRVCCRNTCNIPVYLAPVLLYLVSWMIRKLWTGARHHRFWNIAVCTGLVVLLFFALWAMRVVQSQACQCKTSSPKIYFYPILLSLAVWGLIKLSTWAPRRRIWNIILLPVRFITLPSQHVKYVVQNVEPADEGPALPPSEISEEWQMRRDHYRQMKRLLALAKLHNVFFEVFRRTSAAAKQRLQHELDEARRDANAASMSAAENMRLEHELAETRNDANATSLKAAAEYEKLTSSMREAVDPNEIYHNGESIQYVIRRVKERFAENHRELERKEAWLKGSNVLQAAVAKAREDGEDTIKALKAEHKKEVSNFDVQVASMEATIEAREGVLKKLARAKSNADKSSRAKRAKMQKTHDDTKAALQERIDNLKKAYKKAALQEQIDNSTEAFDESAASHSKKKAALQKQIDNLLQEARDSASTYSEKLVELQKRVEELESKLSAAASNASTQSMDRAAGEQQLKDEHMATMARKGAELAAKDEEIQALRERIAVLAVQNTSLQQSSSDDMDIENNAEPELERKANQITTLNNNLAAEQDRARGLAEEVQGLQKLQHDTLGEGRAAIRVLEDIVGQAERKIGELTNTIQSGNQAMEAMNNALGLNSQRLEELEQTIQSKDQELNKVKDELSDAHKAAVSLKDDVDLAKKERRKAEELSQNQQRDLDVQIATVKDLQDELEMKGSGFQLDPGHDFGFNFERPGAVEQRQPTGQRIFNFPTESAEYPPQSAEQPAGDGFHLDNFMAGHTPLDEMNFDGMNVGNDVRNNTREDDHTDAPAGLDAAEDLESSATLSNLLEGASEASYGAAMTAEELAQYMQRLNEEIDAEDFGAQTGLYAPAVTGEDDGTFCDDVLSGTRDIYESMDDRDYHTMVDSGYGAHAPNGRQTLGNSGDGEAWGHDNPANGLRDFDSDSESEWPEGPAAEESEEEEDSFTERQASNASHMSILGREYRTPKPIGYNPKQPLMDFAKSSLTKSSLTDAYLARKALRMQPSGSGLVDSTESVDPTSILQSPRSPMDSEDESEAGAPSNPHSVEGTPGTTASTGQPPEQNPPQGNGDSEHPSPFSPTYSYKRMRLQI